MSTETVPNKEMIRKHYRALNHNKQTEMRFIQEDRGDGPTLLPIRRFIESEDDFVNLATQLNKDNNVYVGYNERLPDKGLKTDVISCKYYIIDLDSKDENVFNIIKRKLEEIEIYPSFTIHTGGGWHFYFPIEEIKDNNKITSFLNKCKFVLTKLHKAVDPKVYDASRIFKSMGNN